MTEMNNYMTYSRSEVVGDRDLASFPGLPRFSSSVCVQASPVLVLRFAFSITQTEELKRGRPGNEANRDLRPHSRSYICVERGYTV